MVDRVEVRLTPDLQARLDRRAAETGRPADELIQGAVAMYFAELAPVREMLDGRCDDLRSGRVEPSDGEEAFSRLRERSEARGSVGT